MSTLITLAIYALIGIILALKLPLDEYGQRILKLFPLIIGIISTIIKITSCMPTITPEPEISEIPNYISQTLKLLAPLLIEGIIDSLISALSATITYTIRVLINEYVNLYYKRI